jgi:hypothetical protein
MISSSAPRFTRSDRVSVAELPSAGLEALTVRAGRGGPFDFRDRGGVQGGREPDGASDGRCVAQGQRLRRSARARTARLGSLPRHDRRRCETRGLGGATSSVRAGALDAVAKKVRDIFQKP